jgi:hypothetical protein
MPIPAYQVSRDADRYLEEFSTELFEALATAEGDRWSEQFGIQSTGKFKKTFPIPFSSPDFTEFKGAPKFREMYQRSITMVPREYQDGIEEKIRTIEAPDFTGWPGEPGRVAKKMRKHLDKLTAAMLEANPNLNLYASPEDGKSSSTALFANAHPINIFDTSRGTFDNDLTVSAIDAGAMSDILYAFNTTLGPDGEYLGLAPTDVLCHPAQAETWKNLLMSDFVLTKLSQTGSESTAVGQTNNRMKNIVNLIVVPQFTLATVFYVVDRNGPPPWAQQTDAPTEDRFDRNSEWARRTRRVRMSWVLTEAVAPILPQAIKRYTITG